MMKLGTHLIYVDPRITWPGSRNGNINVQLRPQTDTCFALGVMNLMFQNDEYDHDFVEQWIYGLDELKARAAEYPVEKVAEITTVDVATIERVAHILGTERPIGWAWGLAFDQNKNGVQLSQAMILLAAMTGSIDTPGGLTLGPPSALLGKWRMEQRGAMTDEVWSLRIGAAEWPGLSLSLIHIYYLVVGAGLTGAVFAHEARRAGKSCLVIDRRDHIAGNVYTRKVNGINVHEYGAHIFHTSDKRVWDYVNQFAEFNNYVNAPVANYHGELYNLCLLYTSRCV